MSSQQQQQLASISTLRRQSKETQKILQDIKEIEIFDKGWNQSEASKNANQENANSQAEFKLPEIGGSQLSARIIEETTKKAISKKNLFFDNSQETAISFAQGTISAAAKTSGFKGGKMTGAKSSMDLAKTQSNMEQQPKNKNHFIENMSKQIPTIDLDKEIIFTDVVGRKSSTAYGPQIISSRLPTINALNQIPKVSLLNSQKEYEENFSQEEQSPKKIFHEQNIKKKAKFRNLQRSQDFKRPVGGSQEFKRSSGASQNSQIDETGSTSPGLNLMGKKKPLAASKQTSREFQIALKNENRPMVYSNSSERLTPPINLQISGQYQQQPHPAPTASTQRKIFEYKWDLQPDNPVPPRQGVSHNNFGQSQMSFEPSAKGQEVIQQEPLEESDEGNTLEKILGIDTTSKTDEVYNSHNINTDLQPAENESPNQQYQKELMNKQIKPIMISSSLQEASPIYNIVPVQSSKMIPSGGDQMVQPVEQQPDRPTWPQQTPQSKVEIIPYPVAPMSQPVQHKDFSPIQSAYTARQAHLQKQRKTVSRDQPDELCLDIIMQQSSKANLEPKLKDLPEASRIEKPESYEDEERSRGPKPMDMNPNLANRKSENQQYKLNQLRKKKNDNCYSRHSQSMTEIQFNKLKKASLSPSQKIKTKTTRTSPKFTIPTPSSKTSPPKKAGSKKSSKEVNEKTTSLQLTEPEHKKDRVAKSKSPVNFPQVAEVREQDPTNSLKLKREEMTDLEKEMHMNSRTFQQIKQAQAKVKQSKSAKKLTQWKGSGTTDQKKLEEAAIAETKKISQIKFTAKIRKQQEAIAPVIPIKREHMQNEINSSIRRISELKRYSNVVSTFPSSITPDKVKMIKAHQGSPSKTICECCHKNLLSHADSYRMIEGETGVHGTSGNLDILTRNRMYTYIKKLFTKEIDHLKQEIQRVNDMAFSMDRIIRKQAKIIMDQELKTSSFDLRPIQAHGMTPQQIKSLVKELEPHQDEPKKALTIENSNLKENIKKNMKKWEKNTFKKDRPHKQNQNATTKDSSTQKSKPSETEKTIDSKEPPKKPEQQDQEQNSYIELNLLNRHLCDQSHQIDVVEVEQRFYQEIMTYIRCLEVENEQLQMEIDNIEILNVKSPRKKREKSERRQMQDPYKFDEFENFFAQIQKIDFTEKDLKTVFKNKRKSKFDETTPLEFRSADMNDPGVLKSFLQICGIPTRPYNEIMQELAVYIQNRNVLSNDKEMISILQDQLKHLNQQIGDKDSQRKQFTSQSDPTESDHLDITTKEKQLNVHKSKLSVDFSIEKLDQFHHASNKSQARRTMDPVRRPRRDSESDHRRAGRSPLISKAKLHLKDATAKPNHDRISDYIHLRGNSLIASTEQDLMANFLRKAKSNQQTNKSKTIKYLDKSPERLDKIVKHKNTRFIDERVNE